MRPANMSPILILILLSQLVLYLFHITCSGFSIGEEICLFKPYVTSVINITHTTTNVGIQQSHTFTMNLIVAHTQKIQIKGLKFIQSSPTVSKVDVTGLEITWQGKATGVEGYKQSKEQYKRAQALIDQSYGSESNLGSQICSQLTYDAELHLKDNKGALVHYYYRDTHVCRDIPPGTGALLPEGSGLIIPFPHISAVYQDKEHLFMFAPDGRFKWYYFSTTQPSGAITDTDFLQRNLLSESEYSFTSFSMNNSRCAETIMIRSSSLSDLETLSLPMRFITRYPTKQSGDESWFFLDETASGNNFRSWSSKGLGNVKLKNSDIALVSDKFRIVALSLLPSDQTTPERTSVVFESSNHTSFKYGINHVTGANFKQTDIGYIYPQDIVHWSACKKIVSFYGYLYTMHDFDQDFVISSSKWQLLNQSLFPLPPDAVHAEGNEFWFFSNMWYVDVMIADPSNCSRLNLVPKLETQHLYELFNITSPTRPNVGLLSPEPENTTTTSPPTSKGMSSTLIIVVVFLIALILIIAALAIWISRRFGTTKQQVMKKQTAKSSESPSPSRSTKSFKSPSKVESTKTPKSPLKFKSTKSHKSLPKFNATKTPTVRSKSKSLGNSSNKILAKKSPKRKSPVKPKMSKDTSMSTSL